MSAVEAASVARLMSAPRPRGANQADERDRTSTFMKILLDATRGSPAYPLVVVFDLHDVGPALIATLERQNAGGLCCVLRRGAPCLLQRAKQAG